MRVRSSRARRDQGAALLVALGALMVISIGAVACMRASMRLRSSRHQDEIEAKLRDLIHTGSVPIASFLERDAARFVLPLDVDDARKTIFEERLEVDGERRVLRIVAFDLYGVLSVVTARNFGSLARSLPADFATSVDRLSTSESAPLGLDTCASLGLRLGLDAHSPKGGVLSYLSFRSTQAINASSAPIDLVASILTLQGKGGREAIAQARARGELPALPAEAPEVEGSVPTLVSRSRSFGFAITAEVGAARKSYFATYVDSGGWRLTQRVEIAEGDAAHE